MAEPLIFNPVFHHKMWGGEKLKSLFDYPITDDHTGEAWVISAHPHGPTAVANGEFEGQTLDELWANHRELFNQAKGPVFPLLLKILDAKEDLSVQVHPDDDYAETHAHELGKTECWYVLQADLGAKLYYGHNAKTRGELKSMVEAGDWHDLLREVPVEAGDFFFVPSGTVHALGAGVVALETQQSSDTTYRVYDFDRVDKTTGKKRELHLDDALNVITVPHVDPHPQLLNFQKGDLAETRLLMSPYFNLNLWRLNGTYEATREADYQLVSVIEGEGLLIVDGTEYPVKKGSHWIIPATVTNWTVSGEMTMVTSTPGYKA